MAVIKPFNALRPRAELASKVASRPYDVLSSREAREEARDNPYSFYHVSKSEIDLPENVDVHDKKVYEKAKENLDSLIRQQIFYLENKPCYYIYKLVMHDVSQTGLVCVSSVTDYENGVIKKHELTRPEKEKDRINHILTTGAQTGNVFLAYHSVNEIDSLINQWQASHAPVYEFMSMDHIQHSIWVINEDKMIAQITDLFSEKVPFTYIADGHHRAASAAKAAKELKDREKEKDNDAAEFFLTTLFPDNQLRILDYNRVVMDLNGKDKAAFLSDLGYDFTVTPIGKTIVKPAEMHEFGMYLDGEWYRLVAKAGTYKTDPIGILDVTILQNNVLDKWLGIKDPRTDKRIDFVGGIRGPEELVKRVDSGEMKVAFALYPVSMQQLFDIADQGQVMPPKSTWFEPKLRDGLLTHLIL
ncbi:MAG: DUF1015 domain-containing protein [Chitinophagaceae bacterium]|nr:MAG: DUF1015 domain-containing protein [Chitinophagaceae bacterium]